MFVYASKQTFAAVANFCIDHGQVSLLVLSKTKIAPLRELSAWNLCQRHLVLGYGGVFGEAGFGAIRQRSYIKSDSVDEILSPSNVNELHWVSTSANVVDEANKCGKGPSCSMDWKVQGFGVPLVTVLVRTLKRTFKGIP